METAFIQLHLANAPKGLALVGAHLHMTPSEVSARTGIKFEISRGDLGEMEASLIQNTKGRQFGLSRYLHSPRQDYTALLILESTKDLTEDVNDGLEVLGVDTCDVVSFHPDYKFQPHLLWREDDNGVKFLVDEFLCRSDAANAMRRLTSRQHKQRYWITTKE